MAYKDKRNDANGIFNHNRQNKESSVMVEKDEYGDKYQDHLLDQYKIYVELSDRITERRHKVNQYYSSLFTLSFPLIAAGITKGIIPIAITPIISIFGFFLCIIWYFNIKSYKQLNSGKFKVIHEMERQLPFACFLKEWQHLDEGKDVRKYLKLTKIEQYIPFIFSIQFLILLYYCSI
jgi:hypothetical protein